MSIYNLVKSLKNGKVLIPVLQDYIAKENRLVREGTRSRKSTTVRDAKQTIRCMKMRIEEFNHGEEIEGFYVHPSSIGGCMRSLWFSRMGAPQEGKTSKDELKEFLTFEVGTYFHVLFQNLCARAGVLVKREAQIKDKKNAILGHCDGILRINGVVYALEIKTINSRQFTLLSSPKMWHKQQVHCYMKSLGLEYAIVIYFDKDRSELKEYVIQFDDKFYEAFCQKRIDSLKRYVERKKMPDRETEGASKPPCTYCSFANLCYSPGKLKKFVRGLNGQKC